MLFILTLIAAVSGSVPNSCLNCICDVDSDCLPLECHENGDSEACGYYNINMDYFIDCGHPGKEENENLELAWKRCTNDRECAREVTSIDTSTNVLELMNAMSRLHSGGPDGCVKSSTWDYWKKIQRCCGCQ